MNTYNKHAPSVKVCGAVRLETKTELRSVDIKLVRFCRNVETPRGLRTRSRRSPSPRKRDIRQRRQVDHYVRPRLGRSRCVIGATGLLRLDIPGGTNDTLPTHHVPRICSNGSSFPITHAIMTNKRSESCIVVLKQIKARQEREHPTYLLQKRRRLGRLRKRSVQDVSISWRRATRLPLSPVPGCVAGCQISLDDSEIRHGYIVQKACHAVDGACVSSP